MAKKQRNRKHPMKIMAAADLATSRVETCKGFVEQAALKSKRAARHIEAANAFWSELKKIKKIDELIHAAHLRDDLIAVAGVSTKAKKYLTDKDIDTILAGIIAGVPPDRATSFHKDIFLRYMLTKGASFDGEMRNVIGASAQRKVVRLLCARFKQKKVDAQIYLAKRKKPLEIDQALKIMEDEKRKASYIVWNNRMLLFDKKPKIINKSVDAILLDSSSGEAISVLQEDHDRYIACGELKGGIDPAGADEHWKTATAALKRIREVFARRPKKPHLFFLGAAIEQAMAIELFKELQSGDIAFAANLTQPQQVESLVSWLLEL
jgi:hypothetical protein